MATSSSSNSQESVTNPVRQVPWRRKLFRAMEAKSLRNRAFPTRLADFLTALSSTPAFLFLNVLWFVSWIMINIGLVPQIAPFDPYPFGFLTMVVSLEAIVLSIFVLISQNRASLTATLREELHLRVNLIAEEEITKVLEILADMRKEMGINKKDEALQRMLEDINAGDLEESIVEQLQRANKLIDPSKTVPVKVFQSIKKELEAPSDEKSDKSKGGV